MALWHVDSPRLKAAHQKASQPLAECHCHCHCHCTPRSCRVEARFDPLPVESGTWNATNLHMKPDPRSSYPSRRRSPYPGGRPGGRSAKAPVEAGGIPVSTLHHHHPSGLAFFLFFVFFLSFYSLFLFSLPLSPHRPSFHSGVSSLVLDIRSTYINSSLVNYIRIIPKEQTKEQSRRTQKKEREIVIENQ